MALRYLRVTGTITAITYPAYGAHPVVSVTLQVGDALLVVEFMSRRTIEALDIGQRLKVSGNVLERDGVAKMFNPDYIILGDE